MGKSGSITVEDLIDIKRKIEESKTKKAQFEGRLQSIMEQLKKEHDCDSIEDAVSKVSELQKQIEKGEDKLDKMLSEFEEEYGQYFETD